MKATIKKFWKSKDRWYWVIIVLCAMYFIYQIIGGVLS